LNTTYPLTSLLLGGGVDDDSIRRIKLLWMARALAQHKHLPPAPLALLRLLGSSAARLASVGILVCAA